MHTEKDYEATGPNGEHVRVKRDRVFVPGAFIGVEDFEFEGMVTPLPGDPIPEWICRFIEGIRRDVQRAHETG